MSEWIWKDEPMNDFLELKLKEVFEEYTKRLTEKDRKEASLFFTDFLLWWQARKP